MSATPGRAIQHDRWPAFLTALCLVCLPLGRIVEGVVAVMAMLGLWCLIRARNELLANPAWRQFTIAFALIWFAILIALPDTMDPEGSTTHALGYPRYYLAGCFMILAVSSSRAIAVVLAISSVTLLVWSIDVLIQAGFGQDVFGYAATQTRLNGLFGEGGPKFAIVTALLLPLAVAHMTKSWHPLLAALGISVIALAVLLSGTRAAWIELAVVALLYGVLVWRRYGQRMLAPLAGAGVVALLVIGASYGLSDRVKTRVDDVMGLFDQSTWVSPGAAKGSTSTANKGTGIHHRSANSVTHRAWIWRASADMIASHPINGVGARAFRVAFPEHAHANDPYFNRPKPIIASHSHNLVLEVLTETGVVGLLALITFTGLLIRQYRRCNPARRTLMLPFGVCLIAAMFPINTHLAFYGAYWSQILWWLVALYFAASTDLGTTMSREVNQ